MTKFLNISVDNTLGGNSPSDDAVSSQKAVKEYVDAHSGGGGSASTDGVTINTNSSNALQAIGLINKNPASDATNPKYDWVGTLQEYETQQVETLHPDWVCFITDDVSGGTSVYTKSEVDNLISTTLSAVYPVGSVYIGTTLTCPIASLISGSTWTLVSSDRVLQGSSGSHTAGTTIEAGLPNITGYIQDNNQFADETSASGAFVRESISQSSYIGTNAQTGNYTRYTFDSSRSSSIYGNSTTVQPPAYIVNIWERTA